MDVIDQFNALAPKFALLACQLASEVQQLSDTGDIKALKEDRCHWSSEQRQSLLPLRPKHLRRALILRIHIKSILALILRRIPILCKI